MALYAVAAVLELEALQQTSRGFGTERPWRPEHALSPLFGSASSKESLKSSLRQLKAKAPFQRLAAARLPSGPCPSFDQENDEIAALAYCG